MKPEPPWSATQSSPVRIAASSAKAAACAEARTASFSGRFASHAAAAFHTSQRADSTSMCRSARLNATAWKCPIGFPNVFRVSQYSSAIS